MKELSWFLWFLVFLVLFVAAAMCSTPWVGKLLLKHSSDVLVGPADGNTAIAALLSYGSMIWWICRGQFFEGRTEIDRP